MNDSKLRDATASLVLDLEERDRSRPERDSVEDRTGAEVMRDGGVAEEAIVKIFGYSPTPVRHRDALTSRP